MKIFRMFLILSFLVSLTGVSYAGQDYNPGVIPLESSSNVIRADVKSERIPAGTVLEVRMETPVNSHNYFEGDTFRANLLDDIRIGNMVVLPAGTMLRGSVEYVLPSRRFSRGGEVGLNFDHAVTPFGKQIPLDAKVTRAKNLDPEGNFAAGGGYFTALGKNFDTSANVLTSTTEYCVEKGLSFWSGVPVAVTAPLGAFAGTIGGGSYFLGRSIYDMINKGDDVKVNPGDIVELTLVEPMDVPVN